MRLATVHRSEPLWTDATRDRIVAWTACIIVYSSLGGCGSPDPYDLAPIPSTAELIFEGERVSFWSEPDLEICAGTVDHLDEFARAYLEQSSDGDVSDQIVYYYLTPDTLSSPSICGSTSACTRTGHIYASNPVHTHELVHGIRDLQAHSRRTVDFFEEGIAQQHYDVAIHWEPDFSVHDIIEHVDSPPIAHIYDRSAHLLDYVTAVSSWADAERLVDSAASIEDPASLDDVLLATVGETAAEMQRGYSDHPQCSALAVSRLLAECAADPIPWNEAAWSPTPFIIEGGGDFGCDSPGAIGPRDGRIWKSYTVDVPVSAEYRIELHERSGMALQIVACELGCGDDPDFATSEPNLDTSIFLPSGRHVVRASRAVDDPGPIGFTLKGPL